MARPRKEGMDYFPHDVHASSDKKVEALRMLYGNDGYAFYFILLETIYQEVDFELDVSDAETIQILCRKTELSLEKFEMILATALKRGCFDKEEYETRSVLTSNGIKKRADVVVKKRVKMQESYKDNVSVMVSDAETNQKLGVSAHKVKVKEKIKESNKDICVDPPLAESHVDGYHTDFEHFWDVYPKMRRRDKAKAFTTWKKKVKAGEREALIQCTILYSRDTAAIGKDGSFAKMPTTYLNAETYKDYLEGGTGNEEHGWNAGGNQAKSEFAFLDDNKPFNGR